MVLSLTLPAVSMPENVAEFVCALKAAPRRVGAIGSVSAGMRIQVVAHAAESKWIVRDVTLAFSGCGGNGGSGVLVAKAAQSALCDASEGSAGSLNVGSFAEVAQGLRCDIESAIKSCPTGMTRIGVHEVDRNVPGVLAASLLFRFLVASVEWVEHVMTSSPSLTLPPPPLIDDGDRSVTTTSKARGADLFDQAQHVPELKCRRAHRHGVECKEASRPPWAPRIFETQDKTSRRGNRKRGL